MERVERGEDAEVASGALADLARATATAARTPWTPPAQSNLPAEPAGTAPDRAHADGKRALQELRAFHLHRQRPAPAAEGGGDAVLPALLHPYRDLTRVRHEYPLVLCGADPNATVRPLTALVDDAIAAAATGDDAGELLRHGVLRLESIMRAMVATHDGDRLSLVWDRAAATLFETTPLADDKAAALRDAIARARKAITADGEMLSCGPHTPARILAACASAHWAERCTPWRDELDALVRRMDDILVADFDHSDEAMRPEHLRATLGTADDMDVQAMSSLLRAAPHGAGLPEARRARVRATIATLRAMQPLFAARAQGRERAPVRFDTVLDDVAAATAEYDRRMQALASFFKAVRIARLEIQNQYRDAVHDEFFARFGERHLTPEELALVPPVLVRLTDQAVIRAGSAELLRVLDSRAAIKVLLEVHDLYDLRGKDAAAEPALAWPVHLAGMALGLHNAYVLQAPLSRAALLDTGMRAGLRAAGPALFCVGVPAERGAGLAPYLGAAAACESRLFPVLVFDPARGATLAERIDIAHNSQVERAWPSERFAYRTAGGDEAAADVAFTPADFLLGDPRLAAHFWPAPVTNWHDAMLPLHEMLEMPVNEAAGRIPYLLTVDRENRVGRVVVSRAVLEFSHHCRTYWRGLREAGGVENSFAARALAAERAKLTAEKEREIEQVEKNYVAQLEQDVGELTREIVQRIASQLLGAEGTAPVMPVPAVAPSARAATAAPAADPAAPAPAAEAEEAVVIDDPYIDTPLCTSCNECTQLNPRIFAYNANKQAEVKDAAAGPFSDIVRAAELCPVHIIHPGKPRNPGEAGVEEWIQRAQRYN